MQDPSSYYQEHPEQPQMIMYPQPYTQPVIMVNQVLQKPNVTKNKNSSKIVFGAKSIEMICPHCHQYISTTIDSSCNCLSCIAYMFIFVIPFLLIIYQLCINIEYCECKFGCEAANNAFCCYPTCCICPERKNLDKCQCCCDLEHICPHCGQSIGNRNACNEICPPCCCCCSKKNNQ